MQRTYIDGVYSGKYYRYRSKSSDEAILFRSWFRRRYIFNWLCITSAVLIISLLLSGPAGRYFVNESSVLKAIYLLIPSTSTVLILVLSVMVCIKLSQIRNDSFIQKKILNLPWILGEILEGQGYLMINLDLDTETEELVKIADAFIRELSSIDGFVPTAAYLLKIKPEQKLDYHIKHKNQLPRLLAVLEVIKEQYALGNRDFFSHPDPLNYFIRVSHSTS